MMVTPTTSDDRLAPVIPLFGGATPEQPATPAWRTTWSTGADGSRSNVEPGAPGAPAKRVEFVELADADAEAEAEGGESAEARQLRDDVENLLLKRLRARQLSVREATQIAASEGLDPHDKESLISNLEDMGYLDDARLAEQLVYAGSGRKGQGRQAIARTLQGRGIPRDVADAALESLPDDDFERALEYARTKATSLARLEREVGLRRLVGQLNRRGYPGSVAMSAARTALDEASRPVSGVRFD